MFMSALLIAVFCVTPLPEGPTPDPLLFSHFPDRLHAYVWRNWNLVPTARLAEVVQATPEQILELGASMGLPEPPDISEEQLARTYITIIRANWHLLPYPQLTALLGWSESKLAFTLREDDFLYIKLGSLKPACEMLRYAPPDAAARERSAAITALVREQFGGDAGRWQEPPLTFIRKLSEPLPDFVPNLQGDDSVFNPRFCYSYFALYGDPLLEQDPFPEGYLQRLSAAGVNGVWLHAVLYKLSPFPWQPELSEGWERRLERLAELVERAGKYGIQVFLYLNEPRAMPLTFFEGHPELKGVRENDYAAMCTSMPETRAFLTEAVERICSAAPKVGGFFTISASENLTNCWSHHRGGECPRCAGRGAAAVIAELHDALAQGIVRTSSQARLIAWDWGWADAWASEAIAQLPASATLMSVSEWSIPIQRGGIDHVVGEYSISAVGPGPRAKRHWQEARARGLSAFAKIQANTTWELGAVPYIPATANVARHVAALRDAGVSGVMLGWTLGGCPSPNLEIVNALGRDGGTLTVPEALRRVAEKRFGVSAAGRVVEAWEAMSAGFAEFPYDCGVVYNAPLQVGPANLLWDRPTGYRATMVGIPYDDLTSWRGPYPEQVFIEQMRKTAQAFASGADALEAVSTENLTPEEAGLLREESRIAWTVALHYASVANQAEHVALRGQRDAAKDTVEKASLDQHMYALVEAEMALARQLYGVQRGDSRIGFEATNHYFYTPADLVEKVVNCAHLLEARPQ